MRMAWPTTGMLVMGQRTRHTGLSLDGDDDNDGVPDEADAFPKMHQSKPIPTATALAIIVTRILKMRVDNR